MKPEQKFVLSCRQVSESASRLSDWLDHNVTLLGGGHSAVREDIECLAARLAPLSAAAETVPGIGLLAASGTRKTDLLFAILAARTPTTVGEFGQRPIDAATLRSLLPFGSDCASCAIVRFSSADLPAAPRGYPLRIGLLSITDIVAVIAGAFFSSGSQNVPASAEFVDTLFTDITNRLSAQALPGLSERDVVDLRDGLNARWPDNPTLSVLGASRYWEQFRELAPHLTDKDRRRVLTAIWQDTPAFTAIFVKLCDGLDRLGQGADGYCPPEALLGKDKASGWLTRHPRSIVDEATLLTLDQSSSPLLSMMNRYGQSIEIERSVAAALISELPLHLGMSRLNELAPGELLDFPAAPAIVSRRPVTNPSPTDLLSAAVAQFARAKAIYLFERSCQRCDITSLVVVVDPAREDDTYASAISDWVETAQGPNAHARERIRRGLFITAAPSTRQPSDGQASDEARVQFLIQDVIGGDQNWPQAWTPNRPVTDVFWFSGSDAAAPPVTSPRTAALSVTALTSPVGPRADTSVGQLVRSLVLSSDPRIKQLQLNQGLHEVRKRLRQSMLRHDASNDPAALAQWRRSTAIVVQDRLQYVTERGKFGRLHRFLTPSEAALIIPLRATLAASANKRAPELGLRTWNDGYAEIGGNTFGAKGAGAGAEFGLGLLPVNAMAEAAVSHWFKAMRRGTRSPRLCRELAIEPGILHHLIDELQIGALRCTLAAEIAATFAQLPATAAAPDTSDTSLSWSRRSSERACIRMAAVACRLIAAFLDVLGPVGNRSRSGPNRAVRMPTHELEVAEAASAGYVSHAARPWGGARRSAKCAQIQWEISFITLVEENITSSHLLAGRGDKDRELGELIQLFAPGPFEVES